MAKRITGLGRGMEALLPSDDISSRLQQMKRTSAIKSESKQPSVLNSEPKIMDNQIQELSLHAICPAGKQPRKYFDELTISELAQSIFEHGLLQPILVMPLSDSALLNDGIQYRIIAGERRFRACQVLKWQRIPSIIKAVSEVEHFELSLIENIQREDLTPIDEALAYEHLLRISGLSQSEMAKHLGKGRSVLANSLRLLQLPPVVQDGLSQGLIRSGHAKTLLMIKDPKSLLEAYEQCVKESWSVRQVERYCQELKSPVAQTLGISEKLSEKSSEKFSQGAIVEDCGFSDISIEQELEDLEFQLQDETGDLALQDLAEKDVGEIQKVTTQKLLGNPKNSSGDPSKAVPNSVEQPQELKRQTVQETKVPEFWGVCGMLFREEELEDHLAKALHLSLKLRLEGNLNDLSRIARSASVARPRKALLQVEFESPEQWELWLNKLGLKQILETEAQGNPNAADAPKLAGDALFS